MGEIGAGLSASLRLVRGRADAMDRIGLTSGSVSRSFWSAAICLPLFAMLRGLDWLGTGVPHHPLHAAALDLLGYVIGWAGFVLAAQLVLQRLGKQTAWPRMVAVWNWCQVAQYGLLLVAAIPQLLHAGAVPIEFAGLVALGWALWVEWYGLKSVLHISGGAVAGLVALDIAIGILLDAGLDQLAG